MLVTMGGFFSDAIGTVTKVVTAPVWAPIYVSSQAIKTVAGGAGSAVQTGRDIVGALRPPPPPPPPGGALDLLGLGGGATGVEPALSSSLPILIAGGVAVSLLVVALVTRKKHHAS